MRSKRPSREDQALYLEGTVGNIDRILSFPGKMTQLEYAADQKARRAVERGPQIVTEAGIRLGDAAASYCPATDWRSVRNFGNHRRYAYDTVNDEIVWNTIHDKLPELSAAAQQALHLSNQHPRSSVA